MSKTFKTFMEDRFTDNKVEIKRIITTIVTRNKSFSTKAADFWHDVILVDDGSYDKWLKTVLAKEYKKANYPEISTRDWGKFEEYISKKYFM